MAEAADSVEGVGGQLEKGRDGGGELSRIIRVFS
jgi:hypothetical protein